MVHHRDEDSPALPADWAPMKVAFITNLAPYYRRPLFRALAEAHDIDFYFFSTGSERYVTSEFAQDSLPHASDAYRRWQIAGQAFLPDLATRLRRERYDVVVKCLNGKLMVPWVAGLARARNLPLVLWTGMWYHPRTFVHRLSEPLTDLVYRQADAIVVYGEHVKRFLLERQGVNTSKVFVAGQAVDGSRFERAATLCTDIDSAPEVVYVGQLEERKGIHELLEAFSDIHNPDARLTIIGTGSLRDEIDTLSLNDPRIKAIGYVSQDKLPQRLAQARCLVLPSVTTAKDREPWGLVVNEAMHSGTPVITTDAVGAAAGGLVEHEINGLVVEERNTQALGLALARLLDDRQLARSMGECARTSVTAFSYPRMLEAFDGAMRFAIEQHS